jgi:cysteine desulfurase
MLPYFGENFGNASSVHGYGQQARAAVDRARRQVASLIGAKQNEVVFVSGGTEANNLAVRGITELAASTPKHIITSAIEHPSVRGVCDLLEKRGWEITRLPGLPRWSRASRGLSIGVAGPYRSRHSDDGE